jgi:Zn-dependent protease
MALAGPVTNFLLAMATAIIMHGGIAAGWFVPISGLSITSLHGGLLEGFAFFLSVLLKLNILLGVFNLLPVPPLDGYSVLGLVLPEDTFLRFLEWVKSPAFSLIGLLIALQVLPYLIQPAFQIAEKLVRLMPI